jgi:hypothetical protein
MIRHARLSLSHSRRPDLTRRQTDVATVGSAYPPAGITRHGGDDETSVARTSGSDGTPGCEAALGSEDEESVDSLPTAGNEDLLRSNSASEDWISRSGTQDRSFSSGPRKRTSDSRASKTNPDATPMKWPGSARKVGYQIHYVIDGGKSRIILSVLVTTGEVTEKRPMLDLLWRSAFRWKIRPNHVTGDGKYGTVENIAAVEESGTRAYLGLQEAGGRGSDLFPKSAFTYDAEKDLYLCSAGETLRALGDAQD